MTNGDKLISDFPYIKIKGQDEVFTTIQIDTTGTGTPIIVYTEWWNAEYKEPTTKNDLGVDCIDREETLKAMNTWDKFGLDSHGYMRRITKDKNTNLVPYVQYEDIVNCIKNMPSVTPQEPRKGHWKLVQRGKSIDICCSNCEAVRIKGYAYNYTIDQLSKEDLKECFECADMRYCPNCGADMREVEE